MIRVLVTRASGLLGLQLDGVAAGLARAARSLEVQALAAEGAP